MPVTRHKQIGERCPRCERTDVEFHPRKAACKGCMNEEVRGWQTKNAVKRRARVRVAYQRFKDAHPVEHALKRKRKQLQFRFRLQPEDVDQMIAHQGGLCAICRRQFNEDLKPCIDHDHSISAKRIAVRGVLCPDCNNLLGFARDDIKTLTNAIKYLERSRARHDGWKNGAADCEVTSVNNHLWYKEPPMLAAVELPDKLCVVRWSGRVRLHVEVLTVCGAQQQVDGVVQVPDFVLDGRPVSSISDFGGQGRRLLKICEDCKKMIAAAIKGG